jgi:putative hydrolase of HD superfamily
MDSERLNKQIDFIVRIDELKKIVRQSALTDGSRQENVAEHSWHIAVMAILLAEYSSEKRIDILKVIKMLLIHDLVEIYAGDTFLYDDESKLKQNENEEKAAKRIFGILPEDQASDLQSLWDEFEDKETPESRFAKALDALHPVILGYANRGWSWKKHSITKQQVIDHKKPVKMGSETLWKYLQTLLEKAADEGFLAE